VAWCVTAALSLLLGAGCRDGEPAATKPAPTLAQRLGAMPSEGQLDTLRTLERARPDDATIAFHFGNAYYEIGGSYPVEEHSAAVAYYDSAVTAYRRAVAIDSTYSKAYVNMGLAYDAMGKRADARGALRKAIEVNPNDVLAYCHLGHLEQSFGDYGEAMSNYRRALAIDPNSAQAHYNLGLAFAETKVFKEALVEWQKVVALDPNGELGKMAAENVRLLRPYLEGKP
jgi:tetratricopeptide (TPR) repeat protein